MDIQGVILITKNNQTVSVEGYKDRQNGEELWNSWIEIVADKATKGDDYKVSQYIAPEQLKKGTFTDKQATFILQDAAPLRTLTGMEAEFARRSLVNFTNPQTVQQFIQSQPQRFRRFVESHQPVLSLLNANNFLSGTLEGMSHIQRVFNIKEGISFVGTERIESQEDVAWLFRALEDKAIENTFAVMTKGDESIIMHVGIGNISSSIIDSGAIIVAAERFQAEKVWFVHNHPSGAVGASRVDIEAHRNLYNNLGPKLQPGVIINTDTGRYGVFDCHGFADIINYKEQRPEGKLIEIPVYTFDRQVFKHPGEEKYSIRAAEDVARFVSTQRLGQREKLSVIALNNSGTVNAVYHLPYGTVTKNNVRDIAKEISVLTLQAGGVSAILYGNLNVHSRKHMTALAEGVRDLSAQQIRLVDGISIDNDLQRYIWSGSEQGLMEKPLQYGKQGQQKAEIIRTADGKAFIRPTDDGTQPAVYLRRTDLMAYSQGKLTMDELASIYFPKNSNDAGQERSGGFKR